MPKFTINQPSGKAVTVEAPSQEAALDQVLGTDGPDVTALGSLGRGAVGMLPLGDQAYAGVAGAIEHKPYLQERQELNKEIESDKDTNPGSRLAGQALGIAAPIVATAGLAAPESLAAAAGQGALFGGAYGAGNAVDTLANGGSGTQAAGDVALGAGLGAAGGGAGSLVGKFLGGLGRKAVLAGTKEAETGEPIIAKAVTAEPAAVPHVPEMSSQDLIDMASKMPTPVPGTAQIPSAATAGAATEAAPTDAAIAPTGQTKQGLFPSAEELKAEVLAGVLGGSPRQLRALPGKDIVGTLNHMGDVIKANSTPEAPLIVPSDRYSDRLHRFVALQQKSGKVIGDTIEKANVPPVSAQPIVDSLQAAMKFPNPDQAAQMKAVTDTIAKYSTQDKTPGSLSFKRLQQLKSDLGDEAFKGQGDQVLQAAYHTISDIQDAELEKLSKDINKPAFDQAKDAYQTASRVIPMLRMATARSLAKGYSSFGTPLASLMTGHPLDALSHLLKEPLSRAANAVAFSSSELPAKIGSIPTVAGAELAPKVAAAPTDVHLQHSAMTPWRETFQKAAATATTPAERDKAYSVTDFTLSQRDPAYAKAKQEAADSPEAEQPHKMSEGGFVAKAKQAVEENTPVQGFGSTLEGFQKAVTPPQAPVAPAAPQDKMHQPFNDQMEEQLRAFLLSPKKKDEEE